ncbi:MAG: V-type ATP synthase subunit F [Chloroflexota bacterium]
MMPVRELGIAMIGDEDLVAGMRLAGVSNSLVVAQEGEVRDVVRKALQAYLGEAVGIIIIQENYMTYVDDMVRRLKDEKKVFPLIVEVPSKHGVDYKEVIERDKAFIRRFVGFDIQV